MAELIAVLSTQGVGLVVIAIVLFGAIKGIPMFFKWVSNQWEDLKNVFKSYIGKQIDTMEELTVANRELVATVSNITGKVDDIEEKVNEIGNKVDLINVKLDK